MCGKLQLYTQRGVLRRSSRNCSKRLGPYSNQVKRSGDRPSEMQRAAVNFLSDTVTCPSAAMRQVIAAAEVGDAVFGADPSVNRLEKVAAERLGKAAALYVPSYVRRRASCANGCLALTSLVCLCVFLRVVAPCRTSSPSARTAAEEMRPSAATRPTSSSTKGAEPTVSKLRCQPTHDYDAD